MPYITATASKCCDCLTIACIIQSSRRPSPAFYTSNSPRDMGNCRTNEEFFFEHFRLPDRRACARHPAGAQCQLSLHALLPASKERDGFIGLKGFSRRSDPRIPRLKVFIFHSETVIWKDLVTQMQRTKAIGLLHKTVRENASMCRQGIPDYLITMRQPGEVVERVKHIHESYPVDQWQKVASPIWMDINHPTPCNMPAHAKTTTSATSARCSSK